MFSGGKEKVLWGKNGLISIAFDPFEAHTPSLTPTSITKSQVPEAAIRGVQ